MDEDLLTLLRSSKIFSSLSQRALRKLLHKFERVELGPHEILYHQGDPSDSIEILLEGKLAAILTTANGENRVVSYIEPGETVGEIGSLSGDPRTTTIKAVKNSILFKLSSDVFIELCHQYPAVLFEIINPIVSRSQQVLQLISSEKFKKHVIMAPANNEVKLEKFSEKLTELFTGKVGIIFLSDFDNKVMNATPAQIQGIIDEAHVKNIKKIKQKIIYLIKNSETNLAKFSFDKAEMIYIVGDDKSTASLSSSISEKINHFKSHTKYLPELIILHNITKTLPTHTQSWLHLTQFGLHHHIRINNENDFRRLLRFMLNKAVGLVLSGGGTRGWGHLGAIKSLLEAGIPIDAVGGASVGAVIAASYAIFETYEGSFKQFCDIIEYSRYSASWRSLTWPAISLFNAKGITIGLEKLFDEIHIEDLWLPYFCVSTNLATNSESIHRQGLLWKKLRASVALPGIIPPMLIDGELHFDGGLLNNLPVDIMRKIVGHRGTVLAVEIGTVLRDEYKYNFPPILTFWQTLLNRLGFGYAYKIPGFLDTFLKSLLAGSSFKAQQNGLAANLLVSLDLSAFPMLYSNKKQENRIVELGYESTIQQIKNMKRITKAI